MINEKTRFYHHLQIDDAAFRMLNFFLTNVPTDYYVDHSLSRIGIWSIKVNDDLDEFVADVKP